ncbi:hypothetical protein D0869_14933 [Hortaea werneckii]|uniref:CID domain-containing protein n=1 Tax=Hortaea werneckii TaxID=91943 RepID=A0A3M6W0Q7_HORWE|nr:hypothetical protein D0869_14933 [Hortaea werneckii]
MSARSPRGSLSGGSDIASDFEESLRDLQRNDRFAIENLTNIARESTEHAQSISRVLENHIKTTAPTRKLPALYVLDSIIKNVGTPYTVYLGRNLFSTFMEAYRLVDQGTRRAMDGLLKTWKEPVPGSLDTRPVFPPEAVRPIENAMIQLRNALQKQRQGQPQLAGHRNTPTPPQFNGQFGPPLHHQQMYYGHPSQQPTPQQHAFQQMYPQPSSTPQQYPLPHTPVQSPPVDVQTLKSDISSLLERVKAKFATSPYDKEIQTQLNAVIQLKQIVESGMVPAQQLHQVRDTVSGMISRFPPPTPQAQALFPQWQPPAPSPHPQQTSTPQMHPSATSQWQPPAPFPQPYQQAQMPAPFAQPPPSHSPAPSILAPGALNGLQALLANGQKPSTPQIRTAAPALQNASHNQLNAVQNNAAPPSNTADLLAALTKSGVIGGTPTPAAQPPPAPQANTPQPAQQSTASLLQSLSSILPPPSQTGTPTAPTATLGKPRMPFSTAGLKQFRPELVRSLYDEQPNQCSNCGRRFLATDEGRAKKNMHLDWHFRQNQRLADPSLGRGQHRNWFMDEMDWIQLTEFDPSTTAADAAAHAANAAAKKEKGPQDQYVRAPPGMTRNTCSICQEEMRSSYSEEMQDWVFGNAVVWNGKIAHATCVEEIKKATALPMGGGGGGGSGSAMAAALGGGVLGHQRQRSATPDSMLGKRKAEGGPAGNGTRMRMG